MKKYEQSLMSLKNVINTKRNGNTAKEFMMCLKDLYENFKTELSTKFLRTLVNSDKTNRQKTYRIKYLIRRAGLKTQRRNKYTDSWANQSYMKDIIEYEYTDRLIYDGFPKHLFNEFMIVSDTRTKENDWKSDFDKLVLRNAVNSSGVRVKNVREQSVNNFFRTHEKQTLYFIVGF